MDEFAWRRFRNYSLLVVCIVVCIAVVNVAWKAVAGGSSNPSGAPQKSSRVVFLTSNDVYKLVSKPDNFDSYSWASGDLSAGADRESFKTFISQCQGEAEDSCFPMHARLLPGFETKPLHSVPWINAGTGCLSADEYQARRHDLSTTYGGLKAYGASIKALTMKLSDHDTEVVNLHAGDFLGPSFAAFKHKGDQFVQMMSHAGIDVVAAGNHDFDFGVTNMLSQMANSSFLWLAANVKLADSHCNATSCVSSNIVGADIKKSNLVKPVDSAMVDAGVAHVYHSSNWLSAQVGDAQDPQPAAKRVAVKEVAGKRTCIFGTTGQADGMVAMKKDKGVTKGLLTDDVAEALQILREIHTENKYGKCDLVIALTHARTGRDLVLYDLATRTGLHMDAIVGGHDHYIAFMDLKYAGRHTFLLKGGADGHLLMKLSFVFQNEHPVGRLEWIPVIHGTCDAACSDKSFASQWLDCDYWMSWADHLVNVYAADAIAAGRRKLRLNYSGVYDTANARMHETRAINLWADLLRAGSLSDITILFGGGIRQEAYLTYPPGSALSELDILEEFPFAPPGFYVLEVPAAAFLPIVELGVHITCGRMVDTLKLYFSGVEAVYRKSNNTGSGCELVSVVFFGDAHVEGIKDMRADRWENTIFYNDGVARHDLKPGNLLYKEGLVYNGNAVMRLTAPRYIVDFHPDRLAWDALTSAIAVARKQTECKQVSEKKVGCVKGVPSPEWYSQTAASQLPLNRSRYFKFRTKMYDWSQSPPLREPEELDEQKLLRERVEKVPNWSVNCEEEQSREFWRKRLIPDEEIVLSRSAKDNLPVFRFWDEELSRTLPSNQGRAEQIVIGLEDRGKAHQTTGDGPSHPRSLAEDLSRWNSYVRRLFLEQGPGPRNTVNFVLHNWGESI